MCGIASCYCLLPVQYQSELSATAGKGNNKSGELSMYSLGNYLPKGKPHPAYIRDAFAYICDSAI